MISTFQLTRSTKLRLTHQRRKGAKKAIIFLGGFAALREYNACRFARAGFG